MSFILFDIEVFKHNFLCGFKNYETGERVRIWDDYDAVVEYVRRYSKTHMFVGYNNHRYDDHIINAIMKRQDPYIISNDIINNRHKSNWARVPYASIDVAALLPTGNSLKLLESDLGLSIEESNISFEIQRALTAEEKIETENYNDHDIDALEVVFKIVAQTSLRTKFDMIDYFKLDLRSNIRKPLPTIMALGLGAKRGHHARKPWTTYPNLQVDDETREFLEKEQYLTNSRTFLLAGVPHKMGLGGLHGAISNHREKWGYLLDVRGYYTLIQLLYRLLSRSLGEEGYDKVWELYYDRIRRDEKGDATANSLKEGVLSIWGAVRNEYHLLYDPSIAVLITLTGQAFLIDLVQQIEPYIDLIQSNTDGIFIVPKDRVKGGEYDMKMRAAVEEWKERTGFELKIDEFSNLWQKDVNNYACIINGKKIKAKGGYINAWQADQTEFLHSIGRWHKQGSVVDKALVNYFIYDTPLAETINNETDLSMFQYTARKVGSNFTDVLLRETNKETGEIVYHKVFQQTNRVFAVKPDYKINKWEFVKVKPRDYSKTKADAKTGESAEEVIMREQRNGIKYHDPVTGELLIDTGLQQVALIPSMPEDVFVYNGDMNDPGATEYILKRLDREHYINDAQKKLNDYLGIKPERVRKPRNQKITIHVYNEQEFTDLELLLKGEKEWLRDEGMIGELQYSKNEDLLTIINKEKTFTLKLEKNILIQPLVDKESNNNILPTIKMRRTRRSREEIRVDDKHVIVITDCGDYGIEIGLFKGKSLKLIDQNVVKTLEHAQEIASNWIMKIIA